MSSLLNQLNPKQREAVEKTEGPVLIIAGAGSGKTRALTYRVAYLVKEKRVPPKNILAVTFTNKAAQEMSERVKELLGLPQKTPPYSQYLPRIGTFHAICVKILRKEIEKIGYKKSFVIYDDQDQLALMKRVCKELGIAPEQIKPQAILGTISNAKNNLMDEKVFEQQVGGYFEEIVAKSFNKYQSELKKSDALDFDDIILQTVKLFKKFPEVLERYQDLFLYIMVDEYQDTNHAQYILLKMLAQKHKNICVVGDDWQCLRKGSKIETEKGSKNIEDIEVGDRVLASSGRGRCMFQKVVNIKKHNFAGSLIRIRTKSGKEINCTPNHILFSRLSLDKKIFYIYLMYDKNLGYRIGMAKGVRHNGHSGEICCGLNVRANQERADRMWVLKVVGNKEDAFYWENYLSLKYQIPTLIFRTNNRGCRIKQQTIDEIFKNINTFKKAEKLFKDFDLFFDYPHHVPQATIRFSSHRTNLRLTLFSDKRRSLESPWNGHRVSVNSTDQHLKNKLIEIGYNCRKGKREDWRLEIANLDYAKSEQSARDVLSKIKDFSVVRQGFFSLGKPFFFHPAGHIRETMIVPIKKGKTVIEDEVIDVKKIPYNGLVYDMDIEKVHNYISEGIVVHNSIYGWRGADVQNILDFEKDYPDAKVVKLEQNYRSTQNILDAAYCVISKNINRKDKKLWTENKQGHLLTSFEARDEKEEAMFAVEEIKKLKKELNLRLDDFAILYRTNAQSRALEEAFMKAAIPYKIIGGVKFYQRKEIKDIMAYLHFIQNPSDKVNFDRIVNVPARGLGNKSIKKIIDFAAKHGLDILQALDKICFNHQSGKSKDLAPSKIKSIMSFAVIIHRLRDLASGSTVKDLIEKTYIESGYKTMLAKAGEEGMIRHENIQELLTVAKKYDELKEQGLEQFLEEVALVSQTDRDLAIKDAVPMMTLHSAKGLEFDVIFIVGMEEGLLPHSRASLNEKEMEEERRLCYVGITRAKKKAYLLFTTARNIYGTTQISIKSRFLDEIDENLLDYIYAQDIEYAAWDEDVIQLEDDDFELQDKKIAKINDGDHVKHPDFGKGVVVSQDENLITVAFPKVGLKKLAKSVAPLEII